MHCSWVWRAFNSLLSFWRFIYNAKALQCTICIYEYNFWDIGRYITSYSDVPNKQTFALGWSFFSKVSRTLQKKKSPTPLFALCELNDFENYLMLYTLTVELQVLARLVLKHLQAFSDCLRRENLMLMYCDLLRKIVSWISNAC